MRTVKLLKIGHGMRKTIHGSAKSARECTVVGMYVYWNVL
jgi:hypothetical protein